MKALTKLKTAAHITLLNSKTKEPYSYVILRANGRATQTLAQSLDFTGFTKAEIAVYQAMKNDLLFSVAAPFSKGKLKTTVVAMNKFAEDNGLTVVLDMELPYGDV